MELIADHYLRWQSMRMTLTALKTTVLATALLMLAACASVPPAQTRLAETDDLATVTDSALQLADRHGRDRVLVVFDIDNTLLAMEQGLGSDQWYYWQKDLAKDDPCSGDLVNNRFRVQGALYFVSAMRPTQPDAAEQIKRLQDAGLTVIALTSRGPDYSLQTFRELRRNGISFWPGALPPKRGYPGSFIPESDTRAALYQDGVFLTAGQHKGDMLKALLDKTGVGAPAVIVMVDDKAENLQAVMETFEVSGTAVHAWRYSREDDNVATLDTQESAAQWNAVKPALMKIELIFGPDNFDLPAQVVREGCGVMEP
jgi:hypothetical protein